MGVVISGDWTKPGPAGFTRSTQAQESAGRRGDGRRRSENHRSEETAPDLLFNKRQDPSQKRREQEVCISSRNCSWSPVSCAQNRRTLQGHLSASLEDRAGANRAFHDVMLQSTAIDKLTEKVIGCAIAVHSTLGPGLLESIYCACLMIELLANGFRVESERRVIVEYRGQRVPGDLKLDLLVEGCLIIEVKAVERLHPVHQAQAIT